MRLSNILKTQVLYFDLYSDFNSEFAKVTMNLPWMRAAIVACAMLIATGARCVRDLLAVYAERETQLAEQPGNGARPHPDAEPPELSGDLTGGLMCPPPVALGLAGRDVVQ